LNVFGGVLNPAVSAMYSIVASLVWAIVGLWLTTTKTAKASLA